MNFDLINAPLLLFLKFISQLQGKNNKFHERIFSRCPSLISPQSTKYPLSSLARVALRVAFDKLEGTCIYGGRNRVGPI